jgi:hypothetical protein
VAVDYKPIKIEGGIVHDSDGYDYPLEVIARKAYRHNLYKPTEGRPYQVYYFPDGEDFGTLYFYYTPDTSYTAYLDVWHQFKQFSSLSDSTKFPAGYANAIQLSLAVSLAPIHSIVLDQVYLTRAGNAKMRIGAINSNEVDEMDFDPAITYRLK